MIIRRRAEPIERLAGAGLAAGRLAIGVGLWLAPRLSLRALGFRDPSAESIAMARIAATRDLVLGAWQLRSLQQRRELRAATLAAATADTGDALGFAIALGSPEARVAGLRGLAVAVPAAAGGAWLAGRLAS